MELIKIRKNNKKQLSPMGNSFPIIATENLDFVSGEMKKIDTGLDIEIPAYLNIRGQSIKPGFYVIHTFLDNGDGFSNRLGMFVVYSGKKETGILEERESFAIVSIEKPITIPVRFVEFAEGGGRIIKGDERTVSIVDDLNGHIIGEVKKDE